MSHIAPDLSNGEFSSATEMLLFQSITDDTSLKELGVSPAGLIFAGEARGVYMVPREATPHEAARSSRRGFVLHAERWNLRHNTELCLPQAARQLSWPTGSLW